MEGSRGGGSGSGSGSGAGDGLQAWYRMLTQKGGGSLVTRLGWRSAFARGMYGWECGYQWLEGYWDK